MECKDAGVHRFFGLAKVQTALAVIILLCGCQAEVEMKEANRKLLEVLNDQSLALRDRFEAVQSLGFSGDTEVVEPLKEFLRRERPPDEDYIDYDPRINERLCDIVVVDALHELGDDSQWNYLTEAVAQAGSGLDQRIRESDLAAGVILKIGSIKLLQQLIALCEGDQEPVLASAVQTLVAIGLPELPTHQPVEELSVFSDVIELTPLMLADYFSDIANLSKGALVLTEEVQTSLSEDNYQIADGELEQMTLYEVLTEDLRIYGLAYFIRDNKVYICSLREAAQCWRDWWQKYGQDLMFDEEQSRFVLKGEG
jgi:HEAT repeat protein